MSNFRELWNNGFRKLYYTNRATYNKNTSFASFNEFTFNGKPLAISFSDITKMVQSIDSNSSFLNDVFITLQNPTIKSIEAPNDIRETTFYSNYAEQGIDLENDYVFRLYNISGEVETPLFTGVATDISEVGNNIRMTLSSRLNVLAELDGIDNLTEFAGWLENYEWETALKSILDNTDVDYEGDTNSIDYLNTVSERSIDVKSFIDSCGIFNYSEDEIIIENVATLNPNEYGTKYDYVNNTIESFSFSDQIIHYSFKDNVGDTYFIVENKSDVTNRLGQYGQVFLVNEAFTFTRYLGYCRVTENIDFDDVSSVLDFTIKNAYCRDDEVDNYENITMKYAEFLGEGYGFTPTTYGYYYDLDAVSTPLTFFWIGNVASNAGYYVPFFGRQTVLDIDNVIGRAVNIYSNSSLFSVRLDTGEAKIKGADINTVSFDSYFNNDETITSRKRLNESQKSRSYFSYDSTNNKIIMQRASDSAPNQTSYELFSGVTKSYNNFGLNPIGYYDLSSDSMGYIDKLNDDFIHDFIVYQGNIYATMIEPEYSFYTTSDNTNKHEIRKISTTSGFSTLLASVNTSYGNISYGLNVYNNLLSFVRSTSTEWLHYNIDLSTYVGSFVSIGDTDVYSSCSGTTYINNRPILIIFKNQQLQYTDLLDDSTTQVYTTSTIDKSKLGSYLLLSENGVNFTGKWEDFVLTSVSQPRGDLLDLKDLNLLQGLIYLNNMANKSMYVDEFDTLVFANSGTVESGYTELENIIECNISSIENYNKVNVNRYMVDDSELFKPKVAGAEYNDVVLGKWYGSDASFVIFMDIISDTELSYEFSSSSDIFDGVTGSITDVDWDDIRIYFGGDFAQIRFVEADNITPVIPNTASNFTFVFNGKELKKMNVPTTATTDITNTKKTKNINNRFVSPSLAPFLLNDIKDNILGKKYVYTVTSSNPIVDLKLLQLCNLTYYNKRIENLECFFRGMILTTKGTTKFILKEK